MRRPHALGLQVTALLRSECGKRQGLLFSLSLSPSVAGWQIRSVTRRSDPSRLDSGRVSSSVEARDISAGKGIW